MEQKIHLSLFSSERRNLFTFPEIPFILGKAHILAAVQRGCAVPGTDWKKSMSNGGEEGCKNVKGAALLLAASMMTFLLAGCGSNQVTTENTGSSDYRPDRGLPYIISLLVLAVSSKKSRAPKAEGIPYDKGQR